MFIFRNANIQKISIPYSRRHKAPVFFFQPTPELRPNYLVGSVREVGRLLRQHPGSLPLAALVLLQFAVHVLYHGVVHGN